MSIPLPTTEPISVFAGDFITWQKTLADYPAPTYSLSYRLLGSGEALTISTTASGTDHLIEYPGASSTDPVVVGSDSWAAGFYTLTPIVTEVATSRRVTLPALPLTVYANPATASAADTRSHARKVLEAVEAVIEGRASTDQKRVRVNSGGLDQDLERVPVKELLDLRAYYKSLVTKEEAFARGDNTGSFMTVPFSFGGRR